MGQWHRFDISSIEARLLHRLIVGPTGRGVLVLRRCCTPSFGKYCCAGMHDTKTINCIGRDADDSNKKEAAYSIKSG